jgi:hypothetical protein
LGFTVGIDREDTSTFCNKTKQKNEKTCLLLTAQFLLLPNTNKNNKTKQNKIKQKTNQEL